MALVIKPNTKFKWTVKSFVPVDDKYEDVEFDATFKVVDSAKVIGKGLVEQARLVLYDFEGDVYDENDELVTDRVERVRLLSSHVNHAKSIAETWMLATMRTGPESPPEYEQKNSDRS